MPNNVHSPHVKHVICQRQMLHLMGIDVWVTRQKSDQKSIQQFNQTIYFEPIQLAKPNKQSVIDNQSVDNQPINRQSVNAVDNSSYHANDNQLAEGTTIGHASYDIFNDASQTAVLASPITDTMTDTTAADTTANRTTAVSFELEGFSFNHHSILVDKKQLTAEQIQLWQNIVSVLNGESYQLSFPICVGMTDAEYAQQSLDGFLCRLGQQTQHPVLCLSPLPNGVNLKKAVEAPLLADMLITPKLKQTFWQQLQSV